MISIWINGDPKTKGSMEHFGKGKLRRSDTQDDGSSASATWEGIMTYALRQAQMAQVYATFLPGTAVAVRATFWLPTDDAARARCGDLDKLARALGDAGQRAQVYADDVQIVRFFLDKLPCDGVLAPGVLVHIWAPTPVELVTWAIDARVQRSRAERAQGLTV